MTDKIIYDSINVGDNVLWFGSLCVVDQIIEAIDGNHELGLQLNGRVYWDYLSEVEKVDA